MDCEENRSDIISSKDEESIEETVKHDCKSDPEGFTDYLKTFMDCSGNKCVNKDPSVSVQDGQQEEGKEIDGTVPVHCAVNEVKCTMESNNFFSNLDLLPRKRARESLHDSCLLNEAPSKKQHQDSELAAHGEYHYNLIKAHTSHSKCLVLLIDQFHSDPYDFGRSPVEVSLNQSEMATDTLCLDYMQIYIIYEHSHT